MMKFLYKLKVSYPNMPQNLINQINFIIDDNFDCVSTVQDKIDSLCLNN